MLLDSLVLQDIPDCWAVQGLKDRLGRLGSKVELVQLDNVVQQARQVVSYLFFESFFGNHIFEGFVNVNVRHT